MNQEVLPEDIPIGRLTTPEEGCGFTKVHHKKIVGGSEAEIGRVFGLLKCKYVRNSENIRENFPYHIIFCINGL